MKHDELRSIAHNVADSLASGIGLFIGVYEMDIFGEATKSKDGFITVNFLDGATEGGTPSELLAKAIKLYCEKIPELCEKHGASIAFFQKLTVRYSADILGKYALVTIEDKNGRSSVDEYAGSPLRHIKTLDDLGRIRTKH